MPEDAAISGLDDASQARVRLLQSGRAVHAPILDIGLQPLDAMLTALAALVTVADRGLYFTGADAPALFTLTTAGRAILDDADAEAQLTTLGISTFIQTLVNDADAATARTTLDVSQAKATFASVAASSGTSIDLTSIPAGVTRITINFFAVSTNGTSPVIVQLGDSGGVENTGYVSGIGILPGTTTISVTTGFQLVAALAASVRYGSFMFNLLDASVNRWAMSGLTWDGTNIAMTTGIKPLTATLDRCRLTTVGGTDAFDGGGSINISWEF